MVNPLSFINKVVNKARGISPTPAPPRTNPKPQYKPIPKAPGTRMSQMRNELIAVDGIEPISKIESVTSTPLVKRNVNPDPTDELIRKVNDPVLKKDLIDRLDFTPNQFGPKNSGNTKARDFDTFINRPDIAEVKDVVKGQPTGKHLDYWSLGKTRPGSNRTPANDYHDFLMGRDPQKEFFNPKRVKMTAKQSKKFQNELKKNNKNKEPSWWQKMNAVNSDKDGNPTGYTYGLTGKKKKTKEDKKNYGMLGSFGSNLAKFSDDPFFFWQPKDR